MCSMFAMVVDRIAPEKERKRKASEEAQYRTIGVGAPVTDDRNTRSGRPCAE